MDDIEKILRNPSPPKPDDGRVQPFSSGSQYSDWADRNCGNCWKSSTETRKSNCTLERALDFAYWEDGKVTAKVAARIGFDKTAYGWECPEREEKRPYRARKPRKNPDQLRLI